MIWIHALLLTLTLSSATRAQCVSELHPRRAELQHQSVDGIWFNIDVARCILRDVEELRVRRREIALLEERIRIADSLTQTLQTSLENERENASGLEEALRTAREQVRASEWYESPLFWAPISLVLGVVGGLILGIWASS